jgi:pentatricopeptide repeat protein
MTGIADSAKIIVDLLLSKPTITALVGSRVAKDLLPESFENDNPAIVVSCSTSPDNQQGKIIVADAVIRCYGGSGNPDDAEEVFRTVYDAIQDVTETVFSGGVVDASFVTGQMVFDPDLLWPVHISTFRIRTR